MVLRLQGGNVEKHNHLYRETKYQFTNSSQPRHLLCVSVRCFHLMSAPHSLLPRILQSMEAVYSNVANKASRDSNGVSRNFLTRKWKPSQHDRKYISCADVIFVLCHHQTRLEMWEKIDIQFYSALEAALSDFLPNIPTFVIFLLSTNILLVTEQHNILW